MQLLLADDRASAVSCLMIAFLEKSGVAGVLQYFGLGSCVLWIGSVEIVLNTTVNVYSIIRD